MSRRDNIHDFICKALEEDGWEITQDPYLVKIGRKSAQIDLGAEKIIAAEKGKEKIAVEIKSFSGTSLITDFYHAIGQFGLYQRALAQQEADRTLYLALPISAYEELCSDIFAFSAFKDLHHQLIVFDSKKEPKNQLQWIK